MNLLSLFFQTNEKIISQYQKKLGEINALEKEYEALSDEELRENVNKLRVQACEGAELKNILPQTFALVREASKRTLHQRHFDVQILGGMILSEGKIAEMRTGEGKTLVATLPVSLHALRGEGVHVVTVNDYLAARDAVWMGQIYHALGLSVACIVHDKAYLYDPLYQIESKLEEPNLEMMRDSERDVKGSFLVEKSYLRPVSRKDAYQADIVYGTNNEFGFDYLRDNMVYEEAAKVQRGHAFALIDEVDSILIDEARTPLIISAPDAASSDLYKDFARIAPQLREEEHFTIDEKRRAVSLTDAGMERIEKITGLPDLYTEKNIRFVHHLEQALRANFLFKRDKDYIVKDGEILIVDEFTGRLMPGRRYSEGLHQAIEAKEGVLVREESRTLATITFQNYFRLYKTLAGMTGTAQTSAEEFHKVYNLEVVTVPTNKTLVRQDLPDKIFKTEEAKFTALAQEIAKLHAQGQPVLVGTVSIEKNERLSKILSTQGVPHRVLNAKNHEEEGAIIAQAGKGGGVTIATNMAGRGVDILLGGNPPDAKEADVVRGLGGLHVIGTERHEARRIDNQLRGRAGRQGDPGSSQFFVSLEDEVIRVFGGDRIKGIMERLGLEDSVPIENKMVSRAIESAQSRIEGYNFDMRKHLLDYDDVMNKQRIYIYGLRDNVLQEAQNNPAALRDRSLAMIQEAIEKTVQFHSGENLTPESQEQIFDALKGLVVDGAKSLDEIENMRRVSYHHVEELRLALRDFIEQRYQEKETEVGAPTMRQLEKIILLRVIDELWMDHLEQIEYMRAGIGLRAYGQRDPLVAYKNEAHRLFRELTDQMRYSFANFILKAAPQQQTVAAAPQNAMEKYMQNTADRKPQDLQGIGRNDPCPCGSGKKYKKCHGR